MLAAATMTVVRMIRISYQPNFADRIARMPRPAPSTTDTISMYRNVFLTKNDLVPLIVRSSCVARAGMRSIAHP